MITEQQPFCKQCGKNISFSREVVSKNGKQIPLEEDGKNIHNCQFKPKVKCKYCGVEIKFDPDFTSDSGKMIPMSMSKSGGKHRCSARPFNRYTRRAYARAKELEQEESENNNETYSYSNSKRYTVPCNECGEDIFFDGSITSDWGTLIPQDEWGDHDCR